MLTICVIHTEKIIEALKKGKLKITPIRFKLLDVLEHTKKPLRVKDIIKIVKSDIVTVYRNLESLMKLGLVGQVFLDQKEAYFELADKKHHHHAICENCGRVEDIRDLIHHKLNKAALKASGFANISRHSLEFFGICKQCSAKLSKNSTTM
ncbi:MAG: Fur family transcriptional regulator [Patescibacteria group bacterium]